MKNKMGLHLDVNLRRTDNLFVIFRATELVLCFSISSFAKFCACRSV